MDVLELKKARFAMSFVAALLLALIAVSYHAIQSALVNPAKTLKYE